MVNTTIRLGRPSGKGLGGWGRELGALAGLGVLDDLANLAILRPARKAATISECSGDALDSR
jgi:hypothetical protein